MSAAKHKYLMEYIRDPDTYKAVMFARNMIRNGRSAPVAIRIASRYWGVDISDVAHYVGQVGGRKKAEKHN